MEQAAFVGLVVMCAVILAATFVALRWLAARTQWAVPARVWIITISVAVLLFPLFLFRKHWEAALITVGPANVWLYMLAQLDNGFWEELAKLLAILLFVWLAGQAAAILRTPGRALVIGYGLALAYGIGEALTLGVLFILPQYGPLFGVSTYSPSLIGWGYVYERFWAVQLHAIMGGLIGLGIYFWMTTNRKLPLAILYVVAMAFHQFVDGVIILAAFYPAVQSFMARLSPFIVPADTVIGYAILLIAYLVVRRRQRESGGQSAPALVQTEG